MPRTVPSQDSTVVLPPKGVAACTQDASLPSLELQEISGLDARAQVLSDYDPPRDEFRVQPLQEPEAIFRHSFWHRLRLKTWHCLKRIGANSSRLDRFANCGSCAAVWYSPSLQQCIVRANYCRDRLCLACGKARSMRIARATADHFKDRMAVFCTLTIKHNTTPLKDQITRILWSFKLLRRTDFWKTAVRGSISFLECKLNKTADRWHVHLHILAESTWLDAYKLGEAWHKITGDSYIVDVRRIASSTEAASYVAKYAAKPMEHSVYHHPERFDELARSVKGVHLVAKQGSCKSIKFDDDEPTATDWIRLDTLTRLYSDALAGNAYAHRILEAIKRSRNAEQLPHGDAYG